MSAPFHQPDKRARITGRSERKARFALIPGEVIHSVNWSRASKPMRALMPDIAVQYNAHNCGDQCASISIMRPLGWTSPGTLKALLLEAQHFGFLVKTRQGGLGMGPTLYALGWKPIDACIDRKTGKSKLDDPTMAGTMPGRWHIAKPKFQRPQPRRTQKNASTRSVAKTA